MTTFFGIVFGAILGWIGGHLAGRVIAFIAGRMDFADDAARVGVGSALMIAESILLGALGGFVAYNFGVLAVFWVSLAGMVLIPVAAVVSVAIVDPDRHDTELATAIYESPVVFVLMVYGFGRGLLNRLINKRNAGSAAPAAVPVGAGAIAAAVDPTLHHDATAEAGNGESRNDGTAEAGTDRRDPAGSTSVEPADATAAAGKSFGDIVGGG